MVFLWNLSDHNSSQVSRTLLSILFDLNSVVVWMVSTRPFISKSSSPFNNLSGTVPRVLIIIGINTTFMFQSLFFFFKFPNKVEILILLFTFFQFYLVLSLDSKVHNIASSLFLVIILRSGRLAEFRWSFSLLKSQESLCVSFSRTFAGFCLYHLFAWSNSKSSTSPSGSPSPPSRVSSYTLSVLICCIRLLCDRSFRLYHHINYICCFVASYLFLLWYDWSLWRCFVLLLDENQFSFKVSLSYPGPCCLWEMKLINPL